ncbi:MAG: mechanosensitive ion channel family protein [Planctomycetes bacterium]|nr:mechanosensitive ion channel family protein [Planctomycetota bacterium]
MRWDTVYLGSPLQRWAILAASLAALWLLNGLLRRFLAYRLKGDPARAAAGIDKFWIEQFGRAQAWLFLCAGVWTVGNLLTLGAQTRHAGRAVIVVILAVRAVRLLEALLVSVSERLILRRAGQDPSGGASLRSFLRVARGALWAGAAIFLLDNLGVNISALVAGLGIGGIAIAIALQTVLGDLFSALSIYIDRPFRPGDFIIVGDLMGTVEQIGLKTTRVRALGGEQLIFSNSDLTSSRVRNFQRMQERRVVFRLGVTYQTPLAAMREIPRWVREVIEGAGGTRYDRAHFASFGDSSLAIEIVYFVLSPDYNRYMDVQERINLALMERFEREGVEFAYPTQTLFLRQGDAAAQAKPGGGT